MKRIREENIRYSCQWFTEVSGKVMVLSSGSKSKPGEHKQNKPSVKGGAGTGLDRGPKRTNKNNEMGEKIEDFIKAVVVRVDR